MVCKNKQKLFAIHYKRDKEMKKSLPSFRGWDTICAKNKEIAKAKWRRNFPLSPKPKVISASEVKS